jgi:plastocyanin
MSNSGRKAIGKAIIGAIAVVVIAVAGVTIFYVASANTGPPNTSACGSSGASPLQVSIYNGSANSANPPGYSPDSLTLVVGVNNTVTWTNNDSAHHTVTTTSAPTGGDFDSGNMNGGVACTHTFTVPGTYQYDCTYHSWMKGTIVVKASP